MPTCAATPAERRRDAREGGFALIEMLVAMLLLSLVGLTLARFQTFQLAGTADMTMIAAARLEADNIAIDLMAAPQAMTESRSGTSSNAGRNWYWQTVSGTTPDEKLLPDMVRIDIGVSAGPGMPVLARRQLMRPMNWPAEERGSAR